jgi:hypothetical protein
MGLYDRSYMRSKEGSRISPSGRPAPPRRGRSHLSWFHRLKFAFWLLAHPRHWGRGR